MTTDRNKPAFSANGLTAREYFAAAALPGLIASDVERKLAAEFAVILADALIDALNGAK